MTILLGEAALAAPNFHDVLKPVDDGQVIASFGGGYFKGAPAIVRKAYANGGEAYYVGSGFSEELARAMLKICGVSSPYDDAVSCPAEIELACRVKGDERHYFLLNYTASEQIVHIKREFHSVLTGARVEGDLTLPPYGVSVLSD